MRFIKKDFDVIAKNLVNKISNFFNKIDLYKSELF